MQQSPIGWGETKALFFVSERTVEPELAPAGYRLSKEVLFVETASPAVRSWEGLLRP